MRIVCLNALIWGSIWGVGGYILDLYSNPIDLRTPWIIGIPFILVGLYSSFGAVLTLITLPSPKIGKMTVVSLASVFLSFIGIFVFASSNMFNVFPDSVRGALLFLTLGTALGSFQAYLVLSYGTTDRGGDLRGECGHSDRRRGS